MSESDFRHLKTEDCLLLVVDFQERLLPSIHENERTVAQAKKLVDGAKVLGVPLVWTEQYKKGLGPTAESLVEAIGESAEPIEKMTFGCLATGKIKDALAAHGRRTIVLCGIETHICVMQTAMEAMSDGYTVALVEDAVSSRRPEDNEVGIARMRAAGVVPTTVEMLLLEWTGVAGTETFKKILPIIK